MLRLAVTTQRETYRRVSEPLAARDVEVVPISASERTLGLDVSFPAVDVGFVYPPRVMEGGVVDARLDVPWVNGREAVLQSRNKAETYHRLDAAGVPVPDTVVVSNPVDRETLVAAFERFDPPVVVKPNSTTHGVGVARADDLDSFLGIADYLDLVHDYRATGDRSFLVQEFLPDARDYRVMCIDGAYAGAVERRLPADALAAGGWKHNVHNGAEAAAVDPPAAVRRLAEAAAAATDLSYVGVDVLVGESRTVVNETNARPTVDDATKYDEGFYDDLVAVIRRTATEDG